MKKSLLLALSLLFLFSPAYSSNMVDKQTFIYSIKGNDTLRLDKYEGFTDNANKPCIIFVFGGGFYSGARDHEINSEYLTKLAERGYVAIGIDYRLGLANMKDVNAKKVKLSELAKLMDHTITIAVEDLFDATAFVVENAQRWNIDKNTIIANGSSAGAVTVLHGEYNIANKTELAQRLPEGFNYAGVISFAGAIYSMHGNIKWKSMPAPIQMFHGDADSNVPYNKIGLFRYRFYGSKHIAEQLNEMKAPHYFYKVENAAHEIATTPMQQNFDEIEEFIHKLVFGQQQQMITVNIGTTDKAKVKKKFKIKDYIKSNFVAPN